MSATAHARQDVALRMNLNLKESVTVLELANFLDGPCSGFLPEGTCFSTSNAASSLAPLQ
jgi:hypothetical protein